MEFKQEFDDLGEFVAAYRGKISREGMVLVTEKPYPTGTQLEVEIRLSDSLALVRGKGEVVGPAVADEQGVAVRFSLLDDQSADLIDRLERRYVNEGGKPFRIDEATVSQPSAAEPTLFDQPLQPSPGGEAGRPRAPEVASIVDPVTRAIAGSEAKAASSSGAKKKKGKKAKRAKVPKDLLPDGMKAAAGRRKRSARTAVIVGLMVVIVGGLGSVLWFLQQRQAGPASEQPAADAASAVETPAAVATAETEPEAAAEEPAADQPVADTPAQPVATQPAAPSSRRATRIERIDWSERGGTTVVTIAANGPMGADSFRPMRLDNPPRCVLRLIDIRQAYPDLVLEVGGPRVQRIRTWHHSDKRPPELHVVLDLAHPGVAQRAISASGSGLEITVGTGP